MKSVPKLIRRFLIILLLGTILLFALNILVLFILASRQTPGASPWTTALETGAALQKTGKGSEYILPEEVSAELAREHAWGILIDNTTHQVVWHTDDLPAEIPLSYSLAEIASLTRGYLMDYPTFTGGAADGLVVLGYPKDRYWKHMYPNWDYHFIENLPRYMLNTLLVNAIFIFLIYFTANMKLLRSVKPIVEGIGKAVSKIAGWFGNVADAIKGGGNADTEVGKNAQGSNNWKGGLTWVGEKGAELVDLPKGSRILPHKESAAMMAGSMPGKNGIVKRTVAMANMNQSVASGEKPEKPDIKGITDILKEILDKIREDKDKKPDPDAPEKHRPFGGGAQVIIQKLADRIEVRKEEDIDEVADQVAKKVLEVVVNMG